MRFRYLFSILSALLRSLQDVATYGGLCALATFSRQELRSKVLDNIGFSSFLELAPEARRGSVLLSPTQNLQLRASPSCATTHSRASPSD